MLAMRSQARALSTDASKSFARRRLRLSHANVRSTTQRRLRSWKPLDASKRRTISIVQRPIRESAVASLSPE